MGRKQHAPYRILFENESLVVVDKSAGVPVIPERFNAGAVALNHLLQTRSGRQEQAVWVVHRIDKDTSGVVLMAKTAGAHKVYSRLFAEQAMHKEYLAICQGRADAPEGCVTLPLRVSSRGVTRVDTLEGKPSETRYRVLKQYRRFATVQARPLTGRQHQIRVHLRAVGLGLAVDPLYMKTTAVDLSMIKRGYKFKPDTTPRPLLNRLSLHCNVLAFDDPISGHSMRFEAELPTDMQTLIKHLEKWGAEQTSTNLS
ncbi:MAG: RluA family pseudouridine synthase [Calditrichaeota bacterium]|nr:MAG: RluA family pseudouridine synthase [Calditrichota bacterium]